MKKVIISGVVIVTFVFAFLGFSYIGYSKPTASKPADSPTAANQTATNTNQWTPSSDNTYMLLKNVKFRFAEDIYMNIHHMMSITEPIQPYKYADMNNDKSFFIKIVEGQVSIEPSVMETLFRKQVLNYEGAPLKDVKLSIVEMDIDGQKVPLLKTSGMMKMIFWIPFEMISKVGVDKSTNSMTIEAVKVKSLGFPYVKPLMDYSPIKFEHLISIKEGKGLSFKKNTMYVDTMNMTPPPKQVGNILDVQINAKNNCLDLKLGQEKPAAVKYTVLDPKAKNYIYIFNGSLIFGKMLSSNGRLQLIDTNPSDYLDFYLAKYLLQISRSEIRMTHDAAQIVYIVDYQSVISSPASPAAPVQLAPSKSAAPKHSPVKPAATKPKPAPAKPVAMQHPSPIPAPVQEKDSMTLGVEFDTAKSVIKEKYHNNIKEVAELIQKSPDTKVVIEGHTDNVDRFNNPENNMKLSQARAESVRQYLIDKFSIDASRITAVGYGPNKPIADNNTEEGRKKNRRIEAVMEKAITTPSQVTTPPISK